MMERLAREEEAAAAAEEEKAVALELERRKAAAQALLHQHNPEWFAGDVGEQGPPPDRLGSMEGRAEREKSQSDVGASAEEERQTAAAAVAKQRELAKAILQEHNSDWFGELEAKPSVSRKPSFCESPR